MMRTLLRVLMALALFAGAAFVASPAEAGKGNGNGNGPGGFQSGAVFDVDGEDYYLLGPVVGPNGERDIPGHAWVQSGTNSIQGKHYNTGPGGAASWWSSDAGDGALLYSVSGRIDTWSAAKAESYAERGFMHYHEFVSVETGELHPELVVWLQHRAVIHFTLDGGPRPDLAHAVSPGIDFEFIPNGANPYEPHGGGHGHG